jgi:hypothetical protein
MINVDGAVEFANNVDWVPLTSDDDVCEGNDKSNKSTNVMEVSKVCASDRGALLSLVDGGIDDIASSGKSKTGVVASSKEKHIKGNVERNLSMSTTLVVTSLVVTLSDVKHAGCVDVQVVERYEDVVVCCDSDVKGSISGGGAMGDVDGAVEFANNVEWVPLSSKGVEGDESADVGDSCRKCITGADEDEGNDTCIDDDMFSCNGNETVSARHVGARI